MQLGFSLPHAGAWATPQNQVRVAQAAEAHGYSSLWNFQRLLYPIRPQNDYPPSPNQPWPDVMRRALDPVVSLAYISACTSRVRLGTSVLVTPFHNPIVLAKQLATLDHFANGRLEVGLGIGWSIDEYETAGVPFAQRGRRADEFIRCLKAVWTQPEVEFEGEFYRVPRSLVEPKPLQKPHPPITYGGYGPAAVRRAATLADGFNGGNVPFSAVAPLLQQLRAEAERADRDPAALRVVCRGTYRRFDTPQGPDRRPLWGTLDEIREDVARYAEAGLTELFLDANFAPGGAGYEPDPTRALEQTLEVLEALAPGPSAT